MVIRHDSQVIGQGSSGAISVKAGDSKRSRNMTRPASRTSKHSELLQSQHLFLKTTEQANPGKPLVINPKNVIFFNTNNL